ncbi:MAG: hypothetical protein FWG14_04410 [Peptococcaceae bacterium]|nr:hypothetical protein [Peptococcaceae bacterium]
MALIYPLILAIGAPFLILLLIFLSLRKKRTPVPYTEGKKVANTHYITNTPHYRRLMTRYKILSLCMLGLCALSILLCLWLSARPAQKELVTSPIHNRDIFLCMDVSSSLDDVNSKLVERLKELVKSLQGERFGIAVFNTTSILLVPLTDDYEYVLETLDTISNGLKYPFSGSQRKLDWAYVHEGVITGNEERGSSLIGDGLASCVSYFSGPEDDRTRIIIFSTDNILEGTPIVTLPQAAEIAKRHHVTVYGIAPHDLGKERPECAPELKKAVEATGGTLYIENTSSRISNIINSIEQTQKTLLEGPQETRIVDKPLLPLVALTLSLLALFLLIRKAGV